MTTSAAAFVAADMNAVTGVGAPSYTSGVHMWNGRGGRLEAEAGEHHREAGDEQRRRPGGPERGACAISSKRSSPVAP